MEESKPVSVKRLKEHLQHQQEPFSLHSYLSERRYMFKNLSSHSSLHSAESLKELIRYEKHKIRTRFLQATGILRSLFCKFIPNNGENEESSNWVGEQESYLYVHGITDDDTQKTQQTNGLFSLNRLAAASDHYSNKDVEAKVLPYEHHSSTLVNMFHTFTLPKLRRLEVDTGTKSHWITNKDKQQQQHCTESEWKEPLPKAFHFKGHESPITGISSLSQKSARDPMFSTYLRKLLVNSHILKLRRANKDKLQEQIVGTASLCRRNKSTLGKRKQQLLFRSVEKAREFHENEGKGVQMKAISEAQASITSEEWRHFHKLSREIYMEIGDAIMDDIVKEMIHLCLN